MNDQPHVLFVLSWYKDEQNPTLGSFFEEQARAVQKVLSKTAVLSLEYLSIKDERKALLEKGDDAGLTTWRFRHKNRIPVFKKAAFGLFSKSVTKVLDEYAKEHGKPDIIHIQSCFYAGVGVSTYAEKENIPLVITEHFTGFVDGRLSDPLDLAMAKDLFMNTKARLAVSEPLSKAIKTKLSLPDLDIQIIPNMVDDRFFKTDIRHPKLEPFKLFSNGHLIQRKNFDGLLRAFTLSLEEAPNLKLRIAGAGPERALLVDLVQELNLGNNVKLLGSLSRAEIALELQACHAFIQTSHLETFGVSIAEALAAGRAVISTKSQGPESFINEQNGILCDTNSESISKAINRLIRDYSQFNPSYIRKKCKDSFSKNILVEKLLKIYKEVQS